MGGIGAGPRAWAKDDEKGSTAERVKSRLQAGGEFNGIESFRGIPTEGDAKIELVRMTRAAAQEAEEAMGQEEIPRRRREAVQKYFEGIQPK